MFNFLKDIHKRHPIARPLGRGTGCLLWIPHLIDILPELLQSFMQYPTILDRVITALDCRYGVHGVNSVGGGTDTGLWCERCWWRNRYWADDLNKTFGGIDTWSMMWMVLKGEEVLGTWCKWCWWIEGEVLDAWWKRCLGGNGIFAGSMVLVVLLEQSILGMSCEWYS